MMTPFSDLLQDAPLDIVCLSDVNWNYVLWTNRQYAPSTLALLYPKARILYVEPPTFILKPEEPERDIWPTGARVADRRSVSPFCRQVQERIWAVHPALPLPWRYVRKVRGLTPLWQAQTTWFVRAAMRALGFRRPLLLAYTPMAGLFVGAFHEVFRSYEALDEHTEAPFYAWDKARVRRLESQYIRACDVVFTVSGGLHDSKGALNPNTYVVGNPVNFELFRAAQSSIQAPYLTDIPRPILGFYGALSGYKIDLSLIAAAARANPAWSIVLIGDGAGKLPDVFSDVQNVHLFPAVTQDELVKYVAAFDALLMPYQDNPYVAASRPLKLLEYFATGKPVVSTYHPPETAFLELLYPAYDPDSFIAGIHNALAEHDPEKRQRRIALAQRHTWADKVQNMLTLMVKHGLLEKLAGVQTP